MIISIILVFSVGWVSSAAFAKLNPKIPDTVYVIGKEEFHSYSELQASTEDKPNNPVILSLFGKQASEKPSPSDWIKDSQIHVYHDKIVIDLDGAEWSEFTDTNSMDPVIDSGANAIEIIPKSPSQINVGDIIAYSSPYSSGTIIHRVIETGIDSKGWYCHVKGDNLPTQDPGKIRFDQVKRVVVAIIY